MEVDGEFLGDLLGTGTGVLLEQDRVFLFWVEVRRAALEVVDGCVVGEGDGAVFEEGQLVGLGGGGEGWVGFDGFVVGDGGGWGGDDGLVGDFGPAVGEECEGGERGEGDVVVALGGGGGEGFEGCAVEGDGVDVPLDRGFLCRDEVDEVVG